MGDQKGRSDLLIFSRKMKRVFSTVYVAFPHRGCYVFSLDEEECYGSEITV